MRNKLQTILFFLCCLPFMAQAEETVTYLHHDVLGSIIGTSDNAGKLQKTEYLSYGTKNGVTSTESSEPGYTGKPHFKDLGLSYYGSRWYDPDAGRFTGIDPVAWTKQYAVHSFNRYSYANNNPYKYVDPDGEFIFTAIAIAAVAYAAYDGYQSGGTGGALKEASGYNDAVASYNNVKAGNYSGAAISAGSIFFKPLKSTKAIKDLNPLHSKDVVGDRPDLQALSDNELLNSVVNPKNSDYIKINTNSGKVVDGNSRTYELKRRASDPNSSITPNTEVPIKKYTPDNSEFWDM